MVDAERQPSWLFRTARIIEFIAVIGGIFMLTVEVQDRQEARAVRKATMLSALARLQIDHGKKASAAIRNSLEVLIDQDVNLRGLNLSGLDLRWANLAGGKLWQTNFSKAFLGFAELSEADLTFANLEGVRGSDVTLRGVVLEYANMEGAYLARADLSNAEITNTSLRDVTLSYANVSGALLMGTNISGADLSDVRNLKQRQLDQACLTDIKDPPQLPERQGLSAPNTECEYE